ncbi:Secreted RxLR effector peptide protein [Phytophthora palmivora]|uniref:RxLR effector protein n=1 Tax=Phytophthora palmivora TaxID=4796 RepID=A0A2P4Y3N1_9STRA|nr:Secreted RxLR effector peptide protein [Phytophthora palmivora]
MRFYYVAFVMAATFLANTNAVTTDAETNQITLASREIVGSTQVSGANERMLRSTEKEESYFAPLENSEERTLGISIKELKRIAGAKGEVIPVAMENLEKNVQDKIMKILGKQNLSQKKFATKLGLLDVDDAANRNSNFFAAWKDSFRKGKKVKKVPEGMIGDF